MRPKIKLSQLRNLAELQCTQTEVCKFFRIASSTFKDLLETDERAKTAWEQGQQQGKISLRRTQLKLAQKNASMAIFLGKQYLDQKDTVVNEHTGKDGGPIQTFDLAKLDHGERQELRKLLDRARQPPTS